MNAYELFISFFTNESVVVFVKTFAICYLIGIVLSLIYFYFKGI